ncbi:hypothetical protein OG883_45575 [Streptomyces sp. NBC_01142]|uniref:hypothetical protein n=1 Tax=Streptomyces sp. NBC_01142 TaxID=2975865 RepID=UPI0022589D54|nr:hypothetical protein [Streptomyces sp. NBC_01142]MCX4826911.1 hypothetical protein [Streptomyces sp. NBC_01142]
MIDRTIERDAVEIVPEDLPTRPVAAVLYDQLVEVRLGLGGQRWRGLASERRDYVDGRTAFRVDIRPLLPDGRLGRWRTHTWVWADPHAMITRSFGTSPVEYPARPGDAERVLHGPPQGDAMILPLIEHFAPDHQPVRLHVKVGGEWREAKAFRRWTDPDGAVSVQVKICLIEDGWPMDYWRRYHWNPAAITEDSNSGVRNV